MRNQYPEYNIRTPEYLKELWEKCIFCFDTNFLLDLYRYSEGTREACFNLMRTLGERIMLPDHVVLEFKRRRYSTLSQQKKEYLLAQKGFDSIYNNITKKDHHPFFSDKLISQAGEFKKILDWEVTEQIKNIDARLKDDIIFEELLNLFDGKVGPRLEDLQMVNDDGKRRYQEKIPPGYSDSSKPEPERYGDYYIWLQLIEIAKSKKKPIIFISRDEKEDWIEYDGQNKIGPRIELIAEIKKISGEEFHLYNPTAFLKFGSELYNTPEIDSRMLEEVKNISIWNFRFDRDETDSRDVRIVTAIDSFLRMDRSIRDLTINPEYFPRLDIRRNGIGICGYVIFEDDLNSADGEAMLRHVLAQIDIIDWGIMLFFVYTGEQKDAAYSLNKLKNIANEFRIHIELNSGLLIGRQFVRELSSPWYRDLS